MSNKSRANPSTLQQDKFKSAVQGIADRLKQQATQHNTTKAEDTETDRDIDQFVMPMPEIQTLEDHQIFWEWGLPNLTMTIRATYYKGTDPKTAIRAGAYTVSLYCGVLDNNNEWTTSADNAKHIAEILASAHKWETEWRSHAGLYLENNGKLPEQKVLGGDNEFVPDGTNESAVTDD